MANKNETLFSCYFHTSFERTKIERNSKVIKKRNYIKHINNVIATKYNDEQKRNVISIPYSIRYYHTQCNIPERNVILTSQKICHYKKSLYNIILTLEKIQ